MWGEECIHVGEKVMYNLCGNRKNMKRINFIIKIGLVEKEVLVKRGKDILLSEIMTQHMSSTLTETLN